MANIYQKFYVELNVDDASSALRFEANNGTQRPTPVFVLGDTINFDLIPLWNNELSTLADNAVDYTVKIGIGNQDGNYALTEVTYPSSSYGWTGSLSLNNIALGNYLSGYPEREAMFSIGLFKTTQTSASFYTILHTPVTIENEVLSGPYQTGSLAGYWTKAEADARFLKNDQNISGSFWMLTGNNVWLSQETYSVGIGTVNPTKKLDVRGDAYFQDLVTVAYELTGSVRGSLTGTSSFAVSSSRATIANNAITASHALLAATSSFVISASYARSSSVAESSSYAYRTYEAQTALYATSAIDATFCETSSTAFYSQGSTSASYADRAVSLIGSNYPITTSFASSSVSASYSRFALTASYALNGGGGGSNVSSSWASSSLSASYAVNALSASYSAFIYYNVTQSLTTISSASWASSSFLANRATYATASRQSVSSSWASQSFNAVTASYATSIPSHTHAASQVTAGTFAAGNFVFSNQLTASSFRLTGIGEGLSFLDGGGLTSSAGYITNDSRIILIDDNNGVTDGALLFNTRTSLSSSQEELYLDALRFTHKGQRVITGEWISGSTSRFYGTSSYSLATLTSGNSNVSNTSLFASQSRWAVSASWASASLTAVTSSYTHKAENAVFASQSRWATSASFASSSVSSSIASRVAGGSTNYIAKWSANTTLTSSNIIDDNSTVTILKNTKHTGSLYRDYIAITIPEATHNNKWLRIAQFNSSELLLESLSGYLSPTKLKILAVPSNQAGASNRGNFAEVSVINAGFGGVASIAVNNAYTYGTPMATKLRTSKSGSIATWYIDAYIENISASATTDTLQVILLDGRMSLVSELEPSVGNSPTETSILYPGVHNSSTLDYGFRVEGNELFVSASNPLKLLGLQNATDSEFLSVSSTGIVRKGSLVPTASIAVTASYTHRAQSSFFASQSFLAVSASLASSSLTTVTSSYTHVSQNAFFASQSLTTTSASYSLIATTARTASTVTSIENNITHNVENRVLTATGAGTINAEGNLTYDGTVLSLFNTNLASASIDSGSITTGFRMGAGEGFAIYGNQNFFSAAGDAIIFQMEDSNASAGITDGGFVFRGFSPTLTNPTASNWMTIKSGPSVGIGTMFPVSSLHVVGHVSASSFGSGSFHGTASYANRANVASTTLFASQSVWATSASFASSSVSSSYTHKAENALFASQSRLSVSASYASSSTAVDGFTGNGVTDYVARWVGPSTLSSGLIRDDGTGVSINSAPTTTDGLVLSKTFTTNVNSELYGIRIAFNLSSTGSNFRQSYRTNPIISHVTGTITNYGDYVGYFQKTNGGTVSNLYGYYCGGITTGGSITNHVGYRAAFISTTGGTIDTQTGFLVDPLSGSTGATYGVRAQVANLRSNFFNLYVDGTAQNYFAGNVGIGTASYSNRSNVSEVALFASQSRWAVSASFASSSVSASYAPQFYQVNTVSASFASSSLITNLALLANSASYYPEQVYQNNTISASWASRSYYADTAGDATTLGGNNPSYFQPALVNGNTYQITSSWSNRSVSASYAVNALSASYSSYIYYNVTQSLTSIISASWASSSFSSSYSRTASHVPNTFIQSGNSFGASAILGTNDAQSLILETNGTSRLTINSNGFIGINTSAVNNTQISIATIPGDMSGNTASLNIQTTPSTGSCNSSANNFGLYNLYQVNHPTTFASTQIQAAYQQVTLNVSSSLTGSFRVARNALLLTNGVKVNSSGLLYNTYATNQIASSPNRIQIDCVGSSFVSVLAQITQGVSGSMTSFRHFYAQSPSFTGTEFTASVVAGLYVDAQKISNVTNAYGVYAAGASDYNYFAGNVGIGTTTPTSKLVVIGNIEATSITSSLRGTASWATNAVNAVSANIANDSGLLDGLDSSYFTNASNLSTGTVPTGRLSGNYSITSSWASNVVGGVASSSYALKASTADYASDSNTLDGLDSGYFQPALVTGATYTITASRAVSAVSSVSSISASYALKASTADTSTNSDNLDGLDSSYFTNASNLSTGTVPTGRLAGTYSITSSWATNAVSVSTATTSTSASYATVALNVINGNVSASYALKATNADNANNASVASYSSTAGYASDSNLLGGQNISYFQPAISTGATLNITAAVALAVPNNSIALGTKTTGDYVQGIYGDTNITVTGGSGEATNPTISLNSTIYVTASKATDASSVDGYSAASLKNASGINAGTLNSARLSGYYDISVATASYALNAGSSGLTYPTGGATGEYFVLKCTNGGTQTYEWVKLVGDNIV